MIVKPRGGLFGKKQFATKKQKVTKQLQKIKFLRDDWTIHEERCNNDPIYQLLLFPKTPLHLYDNQGNIVEEITFIDRLLTESIRLVMKRNEGYIENVSCINDAFYFLQSDLADTRIKFFVLTFMAQRIPPIRNVLEGLYSPEIPPTHPLGSQKFVKIMNIVDNWVEMTLNFPYSDRNVVTVVRNYCKAFLTTYMVGS